MKKLSRVERKRRRKKIYIAMFFTLLLGVAALIIVFKTEMFLIDRIRVRGNEKVLANKIALFSSIEEGQNIFKINKRNGEKHIYDIPYIKSVEIKRELPREIIISVEERIGEIQVRDGSDFLLLDKEGYILDKLDKSNDSLIQIEGLDIKNKTLGENVFVENKNPDHIDFIKIAEDLNMLSNFRYIDMQDDKSLNILLLNDIKVEFGSVNNVEYKLKILNEVLIDIEKNNIKAKMILMDKGENPVLVLDDK